MSPHNTSTIDMLLSTLMPVEGPATPSAAVPPFNLSPDLSKVVRLLLLAGLAVIGSVGNIFMVSSVMIEDHLNKRGNSFLVNIALADLLVTGLLIPASAVVILAGVQQDSFGVCRFQWFLAVWSFLLSVATLAVTAAENYARLCVTQTCYAVLTPPRITVILLAMWFLSGVAVTLVFLLEWGPDFCARDFSGLSPNHALVGAGITLLVVLLTVSYYVRIIACIRTAKSRPSFKPPTAFTWDYALMKTNLFSFVIFTVFWTPFSVLLALSPSQPIPHRLFDNFASLALSKSCINSFVYCATNRHFRNAYVNLFHYCCCKTTVSFSRRPRGEAPPRPTGDVRVHIIPGYNMYSYTSPQRANREAGKPGTQMRNVTSCRPSTSRANGREVYEL